MHVMFDSMEAVDTSLILVGTYIRKKKKDTVSHVLHFHTREASQMTSLQTQASNRKASL